MTRTEKLQVLRDVTWEPKRSDGMFINNQPPINPDTGEVLHLCGVEGPSGIFYVSAYSKPKNRFVPWLTVSE